jgi:1-acyl-sn-glycerol-3-phosphate acyltransferase
MPPGDTVQAATSRLRPAEEDFVIGPRQKLGFWYRFVVRLLRPILMLVTRRDWRGGEQLPPVGTGVVVSPNHVSYVDPLTFAHFLWDNGRAPRFLAKEGVFRVPVMGRIIAACGQISVSRESRDAAQAFGAAVQAIEAGECVAVYPEGTITRDPDLWPMVGKTGAARVALQTGCDVIPIAQWGAQDLLAPYSKRPRLFPRKTIHVSAGPPVDLDDLRGRPTTPELLHEATDRIMDAITAQLSKLRGELPPETRFDPKQAGVPPTGNPNQAGVPPTGNPSQPRKEEDR